MSVPIAVASCAVFPIESLLELFLRFENLRQPVDVSVLLVIAAPGEILYALAELFLDSRLIAFVRFQSFPEATRCFLPTNLSELVPHGILPECLDVKSKGSLDDFSLPRTCFAVSRSRRRRRWFFVFTL
jgi:hypothetical protein